jgi:hypothetical protein
MSATNHESKSVPLRYTGAKEERRCSSYSFLTSALDGVSGQRHAPAALYPRGKKPVRIVQEAGWATDLVWTQKKFFAWSPFRPVCGQTLY